MCGINGFNWLDKDLIERMNTKTHHRGPDATGSFVEDGISMGNNRLAIIDLSAEANQPMTDNSNRYVVVFNGEIYNFIELKAELVDTYNFKTQSDTEVILAVYKTWGRGGFSKLNGMYAFAIWDKQENELIIARDPVGVKPLFYYYDNNKCIFSSEIKGILEADVPRIFRRDMLTTYLKVLYVPEPYTPFENIWKLPPGHTLSWKAGKLEVLPFFKWNATALPKEKNEKKALLKKTVEEAVERQLVSDRPVGVYLSGGFDSSIILSSMSKVHEKINSYSVGFDLPEKLDEEKFNADFELARKTAEFFGSTHHELKISLKDVLDNFELAIGSCDALISNPTAIPMMLLARFVKPESTVVLSGEGGDELFGGYERYRIARFMDVYGHVPNFLQKACSSMALAQKLGTKADVSLYERFMFQKEMEVTLLLSKSFTSSKPDRQYFEKYFDHTENPRATQMMEVDFRSWLPDQALTLADQMSMTASVEQRVPLLDLKVVEFSRGLSQSDKVTFFDKKKLFKEAFREDLPEFLFSQPKRGWTAPGAKWLRDEHILALVKEILSPGYYEPTAELFDWEEVNKRLLDHVEKKSYHLTSLWAIITFQVWAKTYQATL